MLYDTYNILMHVFYHSDYSVPAYYYLYNELGVYIYNKLKCRVDDIKTRRDLQLLYSVE